MIDPREALSRLAAVSEPLAAEEIDLRSACGRVLSEAIVADRDFPPTDRSAMDGYAVRSRDVDSPGVRLRVVGEVRAGQPATVAVAAGEAVRIMTGAVIPEGADAVVMVERTRQETDRPDAPGVVIETAVGAGQHIRTRAQDRARGDRVLDPGQPIGAGVVAALASVGRSVVPVHRRPTVALLSTGDEIVPPSATPADHQVRNSNTPALSAQLRQLGIEGQELGIARDAEGDLDRSLERGLQHDMLLVTGGVSVGTYDLVRSRLEAAGLDVLFHGVSMKPGKPILAGRVGSCTVIGLPGNPVSTYVGFAVFAAPTLRRLSGFARWENRTWPARLGADVRQRAGRETYHLARFTSDGDRVVAWPVTSTGSGDVLSLAAAEGLVVVGGECDGMPRGSAVSCIMT